MNTLFPSKQELINTILNGLIVSKKEFGALTGYDDWQTWLGCPEYIVITKLMQTIKKEHEGVNLWAELSTDFITTSKKVRYGRIDIVLDDKDDNPRTIIEVKTNIGLKADFETKGVLLDIRRICEVVTHPINNHIKYGLFAFFANRNDDSLEDMLRYFEIESQKIANAYGLKFIAHYQDCGTDGWSAMSCVYEIQI